jgi:hypothetical protein
MAPEQLADGLYKFVNTSRAWLYRKGQQLLINEFVGQGWQEASVLEMQPDGAYHLEMQSCHRTFDTWKISLRLTEDNHIVSACFCHKKGTRLCVFELCGTWSEATVQETADASNMHRLMVAGVDQERSMLLNSFNHSLLRVSSTEYDDALRKYRAFVQSRFGFITDPLTAERLSIEDQIIKLQIIGTAAEKGADSGASEYERLVAIIQPRDDRSSAGSRDVRRILIEAEAAAGKTVLMRQVIHQCCKWDHHDQNDTVPILVLVIDLQRSMKKNAVQYANTDDLIAVYLSLNNDTARFNALMQVPR